MVYIQSIYTYEENNGKVLKDSYRKYMNGELVESRDLGSKKISKNKKQEKMPEHIKVVSGNKECFDFLYSLLDKYGATSTVSKSLELCSIQTIMLIDLISEFKSNGIKLITLEFNEKVKTLGFTIETRKLPTIIKVHYQLNPSKNISESVNRQCLKNKDKECKHGPNGCKSK